MSLVEEAVRNWETQRAGVIAELENTPEEQLDFRPGPEARTLREVAVHIAEQGLAIVAEVVRPDGSFRNFFDPQYMPRLRATLPTTTSKAEVLELLRVTGEQGAAKLREAGDSLLGQTITTLGGVESRLSAVWFGIGHEMYHRGQLAIYQRAMGQVPALTRAIAARAST